MVDRCGDSVRALSEAGHEIMNHSDTHPNMPRLSREKMVQEINACNDKIQAITGKRPDLFRRLMATTTTRCWKRWKPCRCIASNGCGFPGLEGAVRRGNHPPVVSQTGLRLHSAFSQRRPAHARGFAADHRTAKSQGLPLPDGFRDDLPRRIHAQP